MRMCCAACLRGGSTHSLSSAFGSSAVFEWRSPLSAGKLSSRYPLICSHCRMRMHSGQQRQRQPCLPLTPGASSRLRQQAPQEGAMASQLVCGSLTVYTRARSVHCLWKNAKVVGGLRGVEPQRSTKWSRNHVRPMSDGCMCVACMRCLFVVAAGPVGFVAMRATFLVTVTQLLVAQLTMWLPTTPAPVCV